MLKVDGIWVYSGTADILKDITLEVGSQEIVCVIGANGAGKSTLLKSISGLLPVKRGSISLEGRDITQVAAHDRARMGICQVPEGRGLFDSLSVMDNLLLGAHSRHTRRERNAVRQDMDQVFELFPRLRERLQQLAGTMSGGERQMLALARAFLGQPKIMLLDEPSLGLAPMLVKEIFGKIGDLSKRGVPILIVEQNAKVALDISDRGYVLQTGKIALAGNSQDLARNESVKVAYLGAKTHSE